MKQHWKRALSVFLSVVMLFSMTGTNTVLAVERGTPPSTAGLCEHHPSHTEECGYAGGNTGTPCRGRIYSSRTLQTRHRL